MSLRLYFHPLSSFCQKALIALYENDTAFEPIKVDLKEQPLLIEGIVVGVVRRGARTV